MGRFPRRPAYPCGIPSCSFVKHDPEHMIKPTQRCFRQNSQVKIERLEPSQDGPNSSDKPKSQDPNRLEGQCISCPTCQSNGGLKRARARPTGLSEAGRPLIVCIGAKQLPPTSGGNQERPREGGGRSEAPPGRPAPLVSL